MRSIVNHVQSWNWRTILIATVIFMGFYLLMFDESTAAPPPGPVGAATTGPIASNVAPNPTGRKAGQTSHVKGPYDDRWDDKALFEESYPLLGEEYDSPIDAVPGRVRPVKEPPQETQQEEPKEEPVGETKEEVAEEIQEGVAEEIKEEVAEETTEIPSPISTPTPTPTQKPTRKKKPHPKAKTRSRPKGKKPKPSPKPTNPPPDEYFNQKSPSQEPEPTTLETRPATTHDTESSVTHDAESEFTLFPMVTATATGPPKDYHELAAELAASADEPLSNPPEGAESIEEPPLQSSPTADNSKGVALPPPATTTQEIPTDTNYIAICAAIKDIPLDLPEWLIHHYHHLSVSHFYIMDDGSLPPLSTFPLPSSIPSSAVTFTYQDPEDRTGGHSQQLSIYRRCLQTWGSQHTWMAFIDGDEFFEMTGGNETFPQFLQSMEDESIGAVAVNWRMHTSSGYLTRPDSVRKAFINCIWDGPPSDNSLTKSIVRTEFAESPQNPHLWYLKDGRVTVGEKGDLVDGNGVQSEALRNPISRARVALHHYALKSREEYEEKMLRGNAMDDPKGEGFWNSLEHTLPKVACPEMGFYDP